MNKASLLLIIVLGLGACKGDKPKAVEEDLSKFISSELPEDFLSFYMQFHTDSLYQLEHIVFPLQKKSDNTSYMAEDWIMHRPFADQKGEYKQKFLNINDLIIEYIESANQLFKMERRFSRSGSAYNLIYYHVDNAFTNSSDWEAENTSS